MKNLFEPSVYNETVSRLEKLTPETQRLWGKMDVAQMMAHCSEGFEIATGRKKPKMMLVGRLMGGLLKKIFWNEKPFSKNNPTLPHFIIADERVFAAEKERLLQLLHQFHTGGEKKCTTHPHPSFGKLSPQDWAQGMYKHVDHHLQQFGV